MSNKKIPVAVIGAGIGQIHIKCYSELKNCRLVAVSDANDNLLKQATQQFKVKVYTDFREMFKRESIKAVSICTPPHTHKEVVSEAINRKISVLCEKPLALNVKDGKQLVNLAKEKKVILLTGFCFRFHELVNEAQKIIKKGMLGKIRMFRNRFGMFYNPEIFSWKSKKELAGGVLQESSPHSIDLFRYIVGEIKGVFAIANTLHNEKNIDENLIILLRDKNGVIGTLEGSWTTPNSSNVLEIDGTDGSIHIDFSKNNWAGELIFMNSKSNSKPIVKVGKGESRFYLQQKHFLNYVGGITKDPKISPEDGIKALEIVEACLRSISENQWINI
ncbi:MAG: Gfo/Idh/MocA family oxidoreductase [Candidatus Firestonebacteria bacterium]